MTDVKAPAPRRGHVLNGGRNCGHDEGMWSEDCARCTAIEQERNRP